MWSLWAVKAHWHEKGSSLFQRSSLGAQPFQPPGRPGSLLVKTRQMRPSALLAAAAILLAAAVVPPRAALAQTSSSSSSPASTVVATDPESFFRALLDVGVSIVRLKGDMVLGAAALKAATAPYGGGPIAIKRSVLVTRMENVTWMPVLDFGSLTDVVDLAAGSVMELRSLRIRNFYDTLSEDPLPVTANSTGTLRFSSARIQRLACLQPGQQLQAATGAPPAAGMPLVAARAKPPTPESDSGASPFMPPNSPPSEVVISTPDDRDSTSVFTEEDPQCVQGQSTYPCAQEGLLLPDSSYTVSGGHKRGRLRAASMLRCSLPSPRPAAAPARVQACGGPFLRTPHARAQEIRAATFAGVLPVAHLPHCVCRDLAR